MLKKFSSKNLYKHKINNKRSKNKRNKKIQIKKKEIKRKLVVELVKKVWLLKKYKLILEENLLVKM